MSTIEQLQHAYPDLTAAKIAELTDDEIQTMLDAADDAEADADEAARVAAAKPMEGNLEPVKPDITGDSPLLNGHRVVSKARSCPGLASDERGRIIAPGEIITFRDIGNNAETWNRLVDAGAIQLDPDIPDPGRHADD